MKKTLAVATLAGLILGAATMPAISQPPQGRTTLTWFDPNKTDFEKELNLGGKGFKAGNMAIIKDSLFDPETCEKSATVLLRFQVMKLIGRNDAFFYSDGGILLSDGKLTLSFPGKFTEFEAENGSAGAVTGGTEAYKDATGEFRVVEDQQMCERRGALITADLVLQ